MCRVEIRGDGAARNIEVPPDSLLSEVLPLHGSFALPCGGKGRCKRCRVRVTGPVSAPTEVEGALFSPRELAQGHRLACLTRVEGDVTVHTDPPRQLEQIMTGEERHFRPVAPLFQRCGVAVDIGTTTVCATLVGGSGPLGTLSVKNPQTAFGADVISRIEASLAGRGPELARSVRACVAGLVEELTARQGLPADGVDALVITGNTTMLYLLTGQDPEALSHAPFAADRLFGQFVEGETLGLGQARVYLPRCISAFVGADITTAVLASGLCDGEETAALMDIGTNGEIALWHQGRLLTCSTAAGPALEGVNISCGSYAVKGAVDRVWLEGGEMRVSTIGGAPPLGLCGSGVVDAVAAMLRGEIIDETGALQGENPFPLCDGVALSARDLREVQLAKGSIRAGLETLLKTAGVEYAQVSALYIAGGFGNYLNLDSAAAIGLIPPELAARARPVGNAALGGAGLLLTNRALLERAASLAETARTVQLDGNPLFLEQYMEQMLFEF